ncbi:hypothetical protein GCK72_022089 [Caenorhabditis remanei]|uniref:MOFRL-associated domain-containing protein n=1 Tax=Caenorhabditis remanei TaxID=31234 RepID=A0A6A5FSV9_CAERE|nr:hypothetical protein GCK72_022089 [Caenorhabditis remanei]KAF1745642.1 hypothetical protein GCK72_022089 [Caenorhabditis remanei]
MKTSMLTSLKCPNKTNHRPPKTGPVAPTPTSSRPGASPPDTPSPDAPSPVAPSNANPVARIRNSTMMSPRGSSSSMSSDYLEQQADELPNINISEEPTSKKPRKIYPQKFDDGVEYDVPGVPSSSSRDFIMLMSLMVRMFCMFLLLLTETIYPVIFRSDSTNKRKMEVIVDHVCKAFCPKGATGQAVAELAAFPTLTRDVVIVSIGKLLSLRDPTQRRLGRGANAPKNFEASCFAKNYVNPTDRVIEELQKYDEQYHEECDNTDDIIKMYPKFIFLVSQGGEDYFFSPREPVVKGEDRLLLEEKVKIVSKFKDHCATKEQLALVRKILSRVKAGGIINYIKNGYCHGFYMPESLDDEMTDISGGPTIFPEYAEEEGAVKKIMENLGMEESEFDEFSGASWKLPMIIILGLNNQNSTI